MVRMHEREENVTTAQRELLARWLEIVKAQDLTQAEEIRVLGSFVGDILGSISKFAIRVKRHGDADTPGGQAPED